jgi:hypothetical protein
VGFVGEGSVVANRGIGSVAGEWWVSSEIWPWKLGVGEEASSPVRGDLARDGGWVGFGHGGKGLGWGGIKFTGQIKRFIHVSMDEVYGETDEDAVVGNHEPSQLLPCEFYFNL